MACSDFSLMILIFVFWNLRSSSGLPTSHLTSGSFCHVAPGQLGDGCQNCKQAWQGQKGRGRLNDLKSHALHKLKGRATDVLPIHPETEIAKELRINHTLNTDE